MKVLTAREPNLPENSGYPLLGDAGYPYAPEFIGSTIYVKVPFFYRFIFLLTGKLIVKTTMQCDARITSMRTASASYFVWPTFVYKLRSKL